MKRYEIRITKQARKDIDALTPKLRKKLKDILLEVIAIDPKSGKRLLGDLDGCYSYRLSFKDRMVYSIDEKKGVVFLLRAKTHYGQ